MVKRHKIAEELQQSVRKQAHNLCEYCHASELWQYVQFTVDHILPLSHSLFHPRKNQWNEHFIWSFDKLFIIGLTPIGRATVLALDLNRERAIRIRASDIVIGRHPPLNDSIQLS